MQSLQQCCEVGYYHHPILWTRKLRRTSHTGTLWSQDSIPRDDSLNHYTSFVKMALINYLQWILLRFRSSCPPLLMLLMNLHTTSWGETKQSLSIKNWNHDLNVWQLVLSNSGLRRHLTVEAPRSTSRMVCPNFGLGPSVWFSEAQTSRVALWPYFCRL